MKISGNLKLLTIIFQATSKLNDFIVKLKENVLTDILRFVQK